MPCPRTLLNAEFVRLRADRPAPSLSIAILQQADRGCPRFLEEEVAYEARRDSLVVRGPVRADYHFWVLG
ncbi:MAG: hypothetical protein QGH74_08885, partial [Candidatus Brocadiia bacterium]|nr:hypothetical protein [Candidatus Brocadiia bacterium]